MPPSSTDQETEHQTEEQDGDDVLRTPGGRAVDGSLYPRVFWPSAVVIVTFVVVAALMPKRMNGWLQAANTTVINGIGWFYVVLVFGFVVFCLTLAFSPYGKIRLGADDEEPEFGTISWFAMLFAAGMGIGLMFWGVAEPLSHYSAPPPGVEGNDQTLAREAMARTFLHWGISAWAIYVVVGLAVAYAVHRKGLPVSIRWTLRPVLGDRVEGVIGDLIDAIAIIGTLFGVAASLGMGVKQVGAGLSFLGVVDESTEVLQIMLIAGITAVATLSVVSGLGAGIKWLSNINLVLAAVLLASLVALGPTLYILRDSVFAIGYYLQHFIALSFDTMPYQGSEGQSWLSSWTTQYWGWWISWSPFVGIFIARVSKGRTIREFVVGVLLVPSFVSMLWFVGVSGRSMYAELFGSGSGLLGGDGLNVDTALFQMLEQLPAATLFSGLAVVMIIVFFVTSSDSGSFVIDMISTGGSMEPPVWSRVFWAVLEGSIAAALIWAGAASGSLTGALEALQTMVILSAAPFTVVMVLACVALATSLHEEERERRRQERRRLYAKAAEHAAERVADEGSLDPYVDPPRVRQPWGWPMPTYPARRRGRDAAVRARRTEQ